MHKARAGVLEEESEDEFRERLERAKGIANRRFSPLEIGEHITVGELRNRLRELSGAGWYVKPYSNMDKRKLWIYWTQLKKEIRTADLRPSYWDR